MNILKTVLLLLTFFTCEALAQQNDLWRSILGPRTAEIKAAAEAGDAKAQVQLGDAYYSKFSWTNAVVWYRKEAMQGNADGQKALGTMLLDGMTGVKANPEDAIRWLTLAANQGHGKAQLALGQAYARGTHVKRDYVESLKWLTLAERTISIVPRVEADALVLKMTPEEIAEAKKRASAFVPTAPAKVLPVLKLQGVAGTGQRATAIINGKSFGIGEEGEIKVDGEPLKLKCISITGSSVVVAVAGESQQRALELK